jgi:predicted transcriptional regulator
MSPASPDPLSRRERQIMDILFRHGSATVADVLAELPDPPTESAVRSALWLLVNKGQLRHESRDGRNIYSPTVSGAKARRSAVRHLLGTFFRGSRAEAVAAILQDGDARLTDEEAARIVELLEQARRRGAK